MAIKVLIPESQREVTVGGLYQWDFGQTLEIECVELGFEIMEVHFACMGMSEAIVRACTFANGIGTVTIPDQCLEQASTITAWIYSVDSEQGHTVKTIILPVTPRTRPSASRDFPTKYADKYADALTEIKEAVDALEKGIVTVEKARSAVVADRATTATSAVSATYATSAGSATTAGSADIANTATNATYATSAGSANTAKSAEMAKYAQGMMIQTDTPVVDVSLEALGDSYTVDTTDLSTGMYLAILGVEEYDAEAGGYNYYYYSGVGYIGAAEVGEWHSYEIILGGDKVLSITHANRSDIKTLILHIAGKTPTQFSREGALKLYRLFDFSEE